MSRRSRKTLIGLGAVVLVGCMLHAVLLVRTTMRLRRAYAALKADGRPMRAEDITPAEVPDARNAALLYQSAALMLKGQSAGEKNLLERLGSLSGSLYETSDNPDRMARYRQNVAELRQLMGLPVVVSALAVVEEGTRRPTCQFHRAYSGTLSTDAPFLRDVRDLTRTLGARVHFDAEAGEITKAWSTLETQLKLANALHDDPTGMSQLLRSSLIGYSCRLIERLCESEPPDSEASQRMDGLLRDMAGIEPFVRAVDGERLLIGEWFFNLPPNEMEKAWRQDAVGDDHSTPEIFNKIFQRILIFRPRLVADHAAYLQLMRRRVQLLQGPYRSIKECQEYLSVSPWHLVASQFATGGERWIHCRMAANVQIAQAGLALLRYRQAHGAFPQTLDALNLEGLTDPYTDKPLLYRSEGEGFVVYSVGEDLKDNGGTPKPEKQSSDPRQRKPLEGDVLWRYPNPENRIAAGGDS